MGTGLVFAPLAFGSLPVSTPSLSCAVVAFSSTSAGRITSQGEVIVKNAHYRIGWEAQTQHPVTPLNKEREDVSQGRNQRTRAYWSQLPAL